MHFSLFWLCNALFLLQRAQKWTKNLKCQTFFSGSSPGASHNYSQLRSFRPSPLLPWCLAPLKYFLVDCCVTLTWLWLWDPTPSPLCAWLPQFHQSKIFFVGVLCCTWADCCIAFTCSSDLWPNLLPPQCLAVVVQLASGSAVALRLYE